MLSQVELNFSLNSDEFEQQLQTHDLTECNLLIIVNVPSAAKGLKLISKDWFKSKVFSHENLHGISLKINEENIEKFDPNSHFNKLNQNTSVCVSYQSTVGKCESKIYWKVKGHEGCYLVDIDEDITGDLSSFCLGYLVDEIRNGRIGIPDELSHINKIRLQEIKDFNGNDLLAIATSKNRLSIVKQLLENGFDADSSIDMAWQLFVDDKSDDKVKEEANELILCLLKANSRLPNGYDHDKAPNDVKEFVKMCESLHEAVDDDDYDFIKLKLESEPNLVHFYNRNNESLLGYSLKMKRFIIFEFLDKSITTGSHENLENVYENMNKKNKKMLRDQHKGNAKYFPEMHIFILKSKSRIGNNDRHSHKKWRYVSEAYETLNTNNYCRKILKVAAEIKKLNIFFDFKHDSTYYLDPATSIYTSGIIYTNGTIFIGAKELTDDENKFKVFGVLAHELCHLAVLMAFMNYNFDPYPLGDSIQKTRYINQVMVQCMERKEHEYYVSNVFLYPENEQNSEMIVTVPQMLMHYGDDSEIIEELDGIFEELFKYSREVVDPELDRALEIFKILKDDKESLTYEDLTEPMKCKILHSKIIFQGAETTLNDLIGNDQDTLRLLEPKQIRDNLIKDIKIKFGKVHELTSKYKISERAYISTEVYNSICINDRSNREQIDIESQIEAKKKIFDEIKTEVNESKIFLLVDHAGTGKTTSFEDIAVKLKKCNQNYWVSFINLREHAKILENLKENSDFNLVEILKILLKFVGQKTEIELRIFVHLFLNGKLILLFDGFDEISPKYTNHIDKIFKFLRNSSTKNQLWVSSRPHYTEKLKSTFQCSAHQFMPYTKDAKRAYIQNILKSKNIHDKNEQNKLTDKIEHFMSYSDLGLVSTKQTDNSLMIENATELFSDGNAPNIQEYYGLYAALFDRQMQILGKKVDDSDKNLLERFTVLNIHEVLALKVIFEDSYQKLLNFKLDDLVIMKKWNRIKDKLTNDMIQRYGFVNVDLKHEGSINFVHRTYAEFFVAKFIIDSLFDDNFEDSDEEIVRKCNLLDVACQHSLGDFMMIDFFITSNLKNESKFKVYHNKVRVFFIKIIRKIHKEIRLNDMNFIDNFRVYAEILAIDQELIKKLWKTGQENDILRELIFKIKSKNYSEITSFAESSYGPKWHEVLSGQKLITEAEIDELFEDNLPKWEFKFYKNLIKISDLVDNCYTKDEKYKFYKNVNLSTIGNTKIRWNLIPRLRKYGDGMQFMTECLAEICERVISIESLGFVINQFKLATNIDKKLIKKILTDYIQIILQNTYDSDVSGIFDMIKNFYLDYLSKDELQNSIINVFNSTSFSIFDCTEHLYYLEYKKFIIDIFGPSDYSKIINIIQYYCFQLNNGESLHEIRVENQRTYNNIFDLLLLIYSNDSRRVRDVMSKIIKPCF
ncbi:uncharacterized protein [Chironomus tepperi]|uniref:uncharacterized protein n=1 Tax=Chironomus tepperi TaxID=113505 RepID=UPI00391F3D75